MKITKMFLPHPLVKFSIVGSLHDREVASSASDLHGLNFESCVWRAVSSHLSHHPQEVFLAQFSLYVHKKGLKPDSFYFSYVVLRFYSQQSRVAHIGSAYRVLILGFELYWNCALHIILVQREILPSGSLDGLNTTIRTKIKCRNLSTVHADVLY